MVEPLQQDRRKLAVEEYLYFGIMPILFKYCSGLYYIYSETTTNQVMLTSLKRLKEAYDAMMQNLKQKYSIDTVPKFMDISRLIDGNLGQIVPIGVAQAKKTGTKRVLALDDRQYPKLKEIRDLLEDLLQSLNDIYDSSQNIRVSTFAQSLRVACYRKCVINASQVNPEPWFDKSNGNKQDTFNARMMTSSQQAGSMNLAVMLVQSTGLTSAEARYFQEIMVEYENKKGEALDRSPDENIFVKFLNSTSSNTDNFIGFVGRLIERFYGPRYYATETEKESDRSFQNQDDVVKIYLENQILHTITKFFSRVMDGCGKLRESLLKALGRKSETTDELKAENNTLHFFSLFYLCMHQLNAISFYKPFHDFERDLCFEKFENLIDFFKNLCENNCQEFKAFMGEMVPKLKGNTRLQRAQPNLVLQPIRSH